MISKAKYKRMSKRILIERDAVWRFNEFGLIYFVMIRHYFKDELIAGLE